MANRYYTPQRQQPLSAFVPLPMDFYIQQLEKRDQAYKQAMAMISSAEDIYGGREARSVDTAVKNQLIEEQFGDVHKLVKEKYNGDYGKALSDIYGRMAKFNQDPRWSELKRVYDEDKKYRELISESAFKNNLLFNPEYNAMNTPIEYDRLSGRVTAPDYTNTAMERPDYDKILQGTIAKMNMTTREGGLQRNQNFKGLLMRLSTAGMSPEEISKYVDENPDIVDNFIRESGRAFNWDSNFAGDRQKATQFVKDRLEANVRSSVSVQDIHDPSFSNKTDGEEGLAMGKRDFSKIFGYKNFDELTKASIPSDTKVNSAFSAMATAMAGDAGAKIASERAIQEPATPKPIETGKKKALGRIQAWIQKYGDKVGIDVYNEAVQSMKTAHGDYVFPTETSAINNLQNTFEQNKSNLTYRVDGKMFANYNEFLKYVNGGKKPSDAVLKEIESSASVQGLDRSDLFPAQAMVGSIKNNKGEYINFTAETGNESLNPFERAIMDLKNEGNFAKMESEYYPIIGENSVKANYIYDTNSKQMGIESWTVRSKSGSTQEFKTPMEAIQYIESKIKK